MRIVGLAVSLLFASSAALAQTEPAPPMSTAPTAQAAPPATPASPSLGAPSAPAPTASVAPPDSPPPLPDSTERRTTGFEVQARLAVAVTTTESHSDIVQFAIPFQVDVGYRIIPQLFLGASAMIASPASGNTLVDACKKWVDDRCAPLWFRTAIGAQFHISPESKVDPWLGYSFGREWIGFSQESRNASGREISGVFTGWQYAIIDAGLDFRFSKNVGVGPYASFVMGQYDVARISAQGIPPTNVTDVSFRTREDDMHIWGVVGFRGSYMP